MKKDDNKKTPSSRLGSGAEGGFDPEGSHGLYEEFELKEMGQEPEEFDLGDGNTPERHSHLSGLPFDIMQSIASELDNLQDVQYVLEAAPSWRQRGLLEGSAVRPRLPENASFRDFLDYVEAGELGASLLGRGDLGGAGRYPGRLKLNLANSDELAEFAEIISSGETFRSGANKRNILDLLGPNPIIALNNDEEYKNSPNPHDVFRDVCRSFGIIKDAVDPWLESLCQKAAKDAVDTHLEALREEGVEEVDQARLEVLRATAAAQVKLVRIPVAELSSAYFLPDLIHDQGFRFISRGKIGALTVPWSSEISELIRLSRGQGVAAAVFNRVSEVVNAPIIVDIPAEGAADSEDVLQEVSLEARERFLSVIDLVSKMVVDNFSSSRPKMAVDPTVLYRDNSSGESKLVDLDPKREALMEVIRDRLFGPSGYSGVTMSILPPRGPEDVPVNMGGLARNGDEPEYKMPFACQLRWAKFREELEQYSRKSKRPNKPDIVFGEGFPPALRGRVGSPDSRCAQCSIL